jgi:endonuclease-3 related protein
MNLRQVYDALYRAYGAQHWWPGDSPFEVMVGAVLTQNTAWSNVEKAIANLKVHDALDPAVIHHTHAATLAAWLKPSGYFNIKARRLKNFCAWYLASGGLAPLGRLGTQPLRKALLAVNGVGPETADDMLLYAFERPVFVIDAYTRRLFARLQLITGEESYEELRHYFEQGLGATVDNVGLFNEYHALIVAHAKSVCRKKPQCAACCLRRRCPLGQGNSEE